MRYLSRYHKVVLMILFIIVVSIPASIQAINIVLEGFRVGVVATQIDAHNICKNVQTSNGNQYFVPTKTSAEWTTFLSRLPVGATATDCTSCLPNSRIGAPFYSFQSACSVTNTGLLRCWNSGTGAFLSGVPTSTFIAVEVAGDSTVCGITTAGAIQCFWPGTWGAVNKPTTGNFIDIDNENAHFCALRDDGQVRCWGRYLGFMSGDYGWATSPTGTFKAITVSATNACGVRTDDTVSCWGGYAPGIPTASQLAPLQNKNLVALENGFGLCGIDASGKVICGNSVAYSQGFTGYTGSSTFSMIEGVCAIKKSDSKLVCPGVTFVPTDSFISLDTQFAFNSLVCGVTTGGVAKCWDSGTGSILPSPAGLNASCN